MSRFTRSRFTNQCQNRVYLIKKHNSFTSSFSIQVGDLSISTSHLMAPRPLRYYLSLKTWLPNNSFPTVRNRILNPHSLRSQNCSQDAHEAHVSDLRGSFQNLAHRGLFKFKLPAPKISPNYLKWLLSQRAPHVLLEPNVKLLCTNIFKIWTH